LWGEEMKLAILLDKKTLNELSEFKCREGDCDLLVTDCVNCRLDLFYSSAKEVTDEELDRIAEEWAKGLLMCGALAPVEHNKFSGYFKEKMK
jgi:hypothetical protein